MCDEDWAHVNSRSHAHMAHQRAATDANGRACRIAVMFGVALLLLAAQWSGASVGPPPPPGLCAPAGPAGNANCLPCLKWHCHAMMKDRSTCEDCLTHHLDYAAKANCTAAQEATLCSGLAPSPSPSPPGPPPPSPTPAGNCSAAMAVRCPKKGDETDFDTLRLILCITDPAHHHTPLPCTEAEKAAYCIPPPCPGPLPTPPPPAPPKPPPSPGKPLGSLVATPAQESVQACSDGSAARNQFLWNPLTDGRDDALLTGVPGFSTQRGACGYAGIAGMYPEVKGADLTNGGIPQWSNLTAHLAQLKVDLALLFPDSEFSGVMGFDWEYMSPVLDDFVYHRVRELSVIDVVCDKTSPPPTTAAAIWAEAVRRYEAAAKEFFLETLRVAQALRPKARWGFYGHPAKPGKGGYGGSNGDAYRARNNRYQWMWDAGAVAMPELYLDRTKCTPEECGAWVRGMLNETERLLNASLAIQPRPSTVPFTWYYNGTTKAYLSTEYLKVQALVPFEFRDVDAILVWGDIYVEGHHSVEPLKAYAASTYLPMAKSFQAGQCACATKLCSGNGRCYANATACSCDVGWSGVDCSKPTATPPALSAGAAGSPLSSPPSSFSSRHNVVNVTCPDGLNVCPAGTTCGQMHTGRWGCCEYSEAVICGDLLSCCPSGTTCNTTESRGAVPQGTCSTS